MQDTIIGGGLAGLIAANTLADLGRKVVVLERASALGGRARTLEQAGACLNFGPHALYRRGGLARALARLKVRPKGRVPPARGALAYEGGALVPYFPLKRPGLLPAFLSFAFGTADDATSIGDRIRAFTDDPWTQGRLAALIRVSTYSDALDLLPARAALANLKLALLGGVLYLDGGWGTVVEALAARARARGVLIQTDAPVAAIEIGDEAPTARGRDGEILGRGPMILAVSPGEAARLCRGSSALAAAAQAATPLTAAVLDVALSALPRPDCGFALGTEQPLYYSVHSATARLGEGRHVIHVARYGPGQAAGDRATLEALLDAAQPGWRAVTVAERFLPAIAVVHDQLRLGHRRAGVELPDAPGLYLAGDWVGDHGMLADAAADSAEVAAHRLARARAEAA